MAQRLVVYRACTSGALGALAMHLAATGAAGESTVFRTNMNRTEWPPAKELVLIECCGPDLDWLRTCCDHFSQVYVCDHGRSTRDMLMQAAALPANLHFRRALGMLGSVMAVNIFGIQLTEAQRAFFARVQDYVGGIHLYPQSHEFAENIVARAIDYDVGTNPQLFTQLLEMAESTL